MAERFPSAAEVEAERFERVEPRPRLAWGALSEMKAQERQGHADPDE